MERLRENMMTRTHWPFKVKVAGSVSMDMEAFSSLAAHLESA